MKIHPNGAVCPNSVKRKSGRVPCAECDKEQAPTAIELLPKSACSPARAWVSEQESPEAAYYNCEEMEWLIWLAVEVDVDPRLLRLAACDIAEVAQAYNCDDYITAALWAIDAVRRAIRGETDSLEVEAARAAVGEARLSAEVEWHSTNLVQFHGARNALRAVEYAIGWGNPTGDLELTIEFGKNAARAGYLDFRREALQIFRHHVPLTAVLEAMKAG